MTHTKKRSCKRLSYIFIKCLVTMRFHLYNGFSNHTLIHLSLIITRHYEQENIEFSCCILSTFICILYTLGFQIVSLEHSFGYRTLIQCFFPSFESLLVGCNTFKCVPIMSINKSNSSIPLLKSHQSIEEKQIRVLNSNQSKQIKRFLLLYIWLIKYKHEY